MRLSVLRHKASSKLTPVYIADIFFCFHAALTAYVASSFLSLFLNRTEMSLLFVAGALGNLFLFVQTPKLLKRFGVRGLFFLLVIVESIATLGLALNRDIAVLVLSFFTQSAVAMLIYYLLDIFLEDSSTNGHTGHIRGIYLTLGNLAIALSPFLMVIISPQGNYHLLYFYSFLFVLPLFLSGFFFKHFRENANRHERLSLPWKSWWRSTDVRNVTLSRFVLEFFYSAMVIYAPLYLHLNMHFSWSTIGIIFTIMLLPFVLFEALIGEVADRLGGERYIMSSGLLIMGLSLFLMTRAPAVAMVWAILLFISRVGAASVEISTESYFFRRVDHRDTGLISIFRLIRPLSLISAALLGAVFLYFFPIKAIFTAIGIIVILGMRKSITLK